jgi:predicted amidophosphoribosyltransferase
MEKRLTMDTEKIQAAIEQMKRAYIAINNSLCAPDADDNLKQIALACMEKQVAKAVEDAPKAVYGVCPNCHDFLSGDEAHCSTCGQALDWESEAEK